MQTNFKIKNKIIFSKLLLPIYFAIFSIFLELCLFIWISDRLPKYYLIDLSLISFVASFIFLLSKRRLQFAVAYLFISLHIILLFLNITFQRIYDESFSISILFLIRDGTSVFNMSFIGTGILLFVIFLFLTNTFLSIILYKKIKKIQNNFLSINNNINNNSSFNVKFCAISLSFILPIICILTSLISMDNKRIYAENNSSPVIVLQDNDKYLYDNVNFTTAALKKFGTYTVYYRELMNIFKNCIIPDKNLETSKNYIEKGKLSDNTKYHALCKNDNIVVLQLESTTCFAIENENLTPNLYKMYHGQNISVTSNNNSNKTELGSVTCNNYYSKSKTNFTEMGALTGLATYNGSISKTWEYVNSSQLAGSVDFALPKILSSQNYTTNYFINHDINFYGRNKVFNKSVLGFDNVNSGYELAKNKGYFSTWGDWYLESDAVNQLKDTWFKKDSSKNFLLWYNTVVPHGPYTGLVRDIKPNLEKINELEKANKWVSPFPNNQTLTNHYKYYLAAVMDVDKAIGILLQDLQNKNLLKNTTFVLYADHENIYDNMSINYVKNKHKDKVIDTSNPEIYNLPFMVVSNKFKSLSPKERNIKQFVTFFDVYPTIIDLLGGNYNTNLCLGSSIFANYDANKLLISCRDCIFNNNFYTSDYTTDAKSLRIYMKNATKEDINSFLSALNLQYYKSNMLNYVLNNQILKGENFNYIFKSN